MKELASVNRNIGGDGNDEDAAGAQGIAGAGQIIRRNAENVAAQWELQAARLEARVEQMFDGLDDADGAEDVPFDELVGMHGPVFHLVENAFTVLASNMFFLGVVIFVPFSLGRVVLYYLSWLLSFATGPVLSSVLLLTESALSLAIVTLKNALNAVVNLTSDNQEDGLLGQVEMLLVNVTGNNEVFANLSSNIANDLLKVQSYGLSRFSDVTTLAAGYMFIFSLIIFYVGIVALIRYTRGEPLTMGRFYGIASIAETIPSLFRQFAAAMRHLMTAVKVVFLLFIELGVFPLTCGLWLDVCTLRMFGKTTSHRVEFFSVSPLASFLIHWVVGIVFMLQTSIFVSLLRGVLRSGSRCAVKSLLRYWFIAIGWALGLSEFLLPKPEDNGGQENANRNPRRGHARFGAEERAILLATRAVLDGTEEHDNDEPADLDRWSFGLRIVVLLLVAWMTLLVFNSALIVVPISLGRTLFNAFPLLPVTHGIKFNDSYAFIIGSYVIWTVLAGAKYFINHIWKRRTRVLLGGIWKWCGIILKSSALLSIWIFIIPVLIGLLFELLVIVPMRVPVDESPVFLLYQDWALGLIFLKIWTRVNREAADEGMRQRHIVRLDA
ncbi:probable E3 ubiquitin ligase SUD1 isoform X2 [Olea europaea subsp. europaea]|uniref:RING-type E3 ubiquitin transferase n=1 Tax=Olea europaea subsp. europaea TaxID=158383 RepID=A0A8S0PAX3_OLEEU|nr:probable E3 ubiquitin ligase SUD1 isoform X2 [Olea europaea subsp. europaea]